MISGLKLERRLSGQISVTQIRRNLNIVWDRRHRHSVIDKILEEREICEMITKNARLYEKYLETKQELEALQEKSTQNLEHRLDALWKGIYRRMTKRAVRQAGKMKEWLVQWSPNEWEVALIAFRQRTGFDAREQLVNGGSARNPVTTVTMHIYQLKELSQKGLFYFKRAKNKLEVQDVIIFQYRPNRCRELKLSFRVVRINTNAPEGHQIQGRAD